MNSLEEKVSKLPPSIETTTTISSRCYQSSSSSSSSSSSMGGNRKVIRILTVAVYVLAVSLAAIMLSLYYIFIWDPTTIRPFITKSSNCDKIVIPEKIAIRLLNSTEITADQFYTYIHAQYRFMQQLQQQRQQFLQQQHVKLQQMAADGGNRFKEIFATATIIQANANDVPSKPVTPTNGTFLWDARQAEAAAAAAAAAEMNANNVGIGSGGRRKSHRKHYSHHRHNTRRSSHRHSTAYPPQQQPLSSPPPTFVLPPPTTPPSPIVLGADANIAMLAHTHHIVNMGVAMEDGVNGEVNDVAAALALNAPIIAPTTLQHNQRDASSPLMLYTPMPIPLILNSKESAAAAAAVEVAAAAVGATTFDDSGESAGVLLPKRSPRIGEKKQQMNSARKRTAAAATFLSHKSYNSDNKDNHRGVGAGMGILADGYENYLNPFLTGELIFEK